MLNQDLINRYSALLHCFLSYLLYSHHDEAKDNPDDDGDAYNHNKIKIQSKLISGKG